MEIPSKTKTKQWLLIISIMVFVFLLIHLLSHWFKRNTTENLQLKHTQKMNLPTVGNADLQNLWVQKLEGKIKGQSDEVSLALKELETQKKRNVELQSSFIQKNEELSRKLESLKAVSLPKLDDVGACSPHFSSSSSSSNLPSVANPLSNSSANAQQNRSPIISQRFKLSEPKKIKHQKDNYLPAGSFVDAVILGGIDAAAGVSAQSEPRPVLLRLVDLSVLPNRFRKDIIDCHVIAAGFGDISSERAYIRTERLSCTLVNGDIFEEKIEAYLAGEDGKDGLRGTVIRREGDLIFNSFLAGTIAGLGKGLSQSFGTTALSPLGSTKTGTGSEILKSGLYGGAGEGGDQLQKYFIQRAEQMHPVVQISAGRTATIVFLKGVELDVSKTH